MRLLGDFFEVVNTVSDNPCAWRIRLNAEHVIYKAHFPGNPITPGVCMIQMLTELMEMHLNKRLELKTVHNVKFLSILSPIDDQEVMVQIKKLTVEDGLYKVQSIFYSETIQLAKISILYEAV